MMRAGKEMCGTRCRRVCVCRRPVQFSPRRRPILIGNADAFAAAVRQGFELVLWVVEAFCRPRPAPLLEGIDVAATAPGGRKQGEHDEASLQHDLPLVEEREAPSSWPWYSVVALSYLVAIAPTGPGGDGLAKNGAPANSTRYITRRS